MEPPTGLCRGAIPPRCVISSRAIYLNDSELRWQALTKKPDVQNIEDVQSYADTRQISINRVGMKDINHPVRLTWCEAIVTIPEKTDP